MPVAFVVLGCNCILKGTHKRGVLMTGSFLAGALASAFAAWLMLPATWSLPFWTTLQATVDAETYGHAVEHYAEGIVLMMTFAAVLGGSALAGATALGTRFRKSRF